ncbi:MAG: S8 family serine peptidase [Acidobacteriota bacterium]|jgi:hypothetical protein
MRAPRFHRTLLVVLLLIPTAGIAAGPDPAVTPPEGLWLDTPHRVPPSDRFVPDARDALEDEKGAAVDPAEIWFRNGHRLRPEPGLDPALAEPVQGILLLQFPDRILREWREDLEAAGITVRDYVQSHTYLARVPPEASEKVAGWLRDGRLRYAGPYPPAAKVASVLKRPLEGMVEVDVVLLEEPEPAELVALEGILAVDYRGVGRTPFLRGRIDRDGIEQLATLDGVIWIEPHLEGRNQNLEAAMSGAADDVVALGVFDGTGVRVAVDDSGITRTGSLAECGGTGAAYHPDIAATRIADEWDYYNGDANACDDNAHGTHVTGTIGGDGTNTAAWTGIAPDVTFLIYKDCCNSAGGGYFHFDQILARAALHDADIVANSWGGGNGIYALSSQQADQAVLGHWDGSDGIPQFMFLSVSTGNDADLALAPSTAKNVVSVGATKDGNAPDGLRCWGTHTCNFTGCGCTPARCGDTYSPADERICFSNWGPLDTDGDGHTRIKPDVVAPGTRIHSLAPAHLYADRRLYRDSDGTSMAQPQVAGVAALMLEAYPQNRNWPEMTKARLLATAVPMGSPAYFGHGMVDALHAVFSSETLDSLIWDGSSISGTGNEQDHAFTVPAGFQEVRVYLVWTDAASTTTEVVNDLDLRIYDGSGALVGSSATYDDNVEYAKIFTGTPGTWRANVRGYNVPQPTAFYGLIAVAIREPASLSMDVSPATICEQPGGSFQFESSLRNAGHTVVASETVLDLPDDPAVFQLDSAQLRSQESPRSHWYQFNEILHEPVPNEYSVFTGAVHKTISRRVTWSLDVGPTVPDGSYMLLAKGTAYGYIYYGNIVDVTVDGTSPTAVGNLDSYTHRPGLCYNEPWIGVQWDPSFDAGCGLGGYWAEWSLGAPASPEGGYFLPPDATSNDVVLEASVQPFFFNIMPEDAAGNRAGYQSWGPVWFDNVPPPGVTNLASESHPLYSCRVPSDAAIFWTPAVDDNCGVRGYSVSWSEILPGLPDVVMDIGPEDHLILPAPASNHPLYFNIRTVDDADNWSTWAPAYGPIWVDTIPGAVAEFFVAPYSPDLNFWWVPIPDADFYRVYQDTDPQFPHPVQINDDVTTNSLYHPGGMSGPERILYYKVVGTSICGAEGP